MNLGVWGSVTISKTFTLIFFFLGSFLLLPGVLPRYCEKVGKAFFLKYQFTESMVHLVHLTQLFLCFPTLGGHFWAYI